MVRLLVTGREAAEDQDVLVGDLVEATALQTNPVRVLFDPQIERLPVLSPLDVVLFDEIRTLASIESSYDIQGLIVESNCCVEVAACVQASHLRPSVAAHIVHFTLVHRLAGQGASDRVDA